MSTTVVGSRKSPLDIPELIEHCVGFLLDPKDLRPITLIFRNTVGHQWRERKRISIARKISHPHLPIAGNTQGGAAPRRIYIDPVRQRTPDNFLRICSLPLTRLRILYIAGGSNLAAQACLGIRGLLSFSTIVSFSIFCRFSCTEDFLRIWENCSPNLKHLLLGTSISGMQTPTPAEGIAVHDRITLHSLEFGYGFPSDLEWWLDDARCPLDFSGLKALRFTRDTGVFRQRILAPALRTIKLVASNTLETVDLTPFEQLTEVETTIFSHDHAQTFETISSINGSSRPFVRAICFCLLPSPTLDIDTCLQIDREISEIRKHFPNLAIVHITIATATPTLTKSLDQYFPFWDHKISL
ncbi:hypothetical protein B0H19DRAFT_1383587 [Mycena capillaripes]|nr:hypothetical protein B0H19DRAFT_1383587 [Mycena capillaripes]